MTPDNLEISTDNLVQPLRRSLARLESALSKVDEPIIIFDENNNLEWCNNSFEKMVMKSRLFMLGQNISTCLAPLINAHHDQPDRRLSKDQHDANLEPLLKLSEGNFNISFKSKAGLSHYECEIKKINVELNTKIVVLKNTDHLIVIDNLQDSLDTCSLTGLLNRRGLTRHLEKEFAQGKKDSMGLIFLDLNKFKEINDSFGHEIGDKVLKQFSDKLIEATRQCDVVSRLSGDEFVIVASKINAKTAKSSIGKIIKRLIKLTEIPIKLNRGDQEISIRIRSSAGASLGCNANSPKELLSQADNAMYQAKQNSDQLHYYGKDLEITRAKNNFIRESAKTIIETRKIPFHLQPIFDLSLEQCIGYEVLMRPTSNDGMLLPPLDFVKYFESSNNISEIDQIVLESVLTCNGIENIVRSQDRISINLSALTLKKNGMARLILQKIQNARWINNKQMIIEITETGFIDNLDHLRSEVVQLVEAGITILLDDFGSGFTGFTQLLELPIQGFKIDQKLFQDSLKHDKHSAVLQAMAMIAEKINMTVVVEGIEKQEHQKHMQTLGFQYAQGFGLGLPMPPDYYLTKDNNYEKQGLSCVLGKHQSSPFNPDYAAKI